MQTSTSTALPEPQTDLQYPVFSRQLFLKIAQAALKVKEYRFAQEVILGWLSAFPGDLQASLVYAGALLGNQRSKQAIRVLEGLCQVDPEFSPAVTALQAAYRQNGGTPKGSAAEPSGQSFTDDLMAQWTAALGAVQAKDRAVSPVAWGSALAQVRRQIDQQDFPDALQAILPILGQDLGSPLPAVIHLHLMQRSGQAPLQAVHSLAEHYLRRWPDCLVFKLYIAESLLESGETARGVALLHEAARRDIAGQVPARMWGAAHRYQSLWPTRLELEFRWLVPAEVAAEIGWNMLPAGELVFVAPETEIVERSDSVDTVLAAAAISNLIDAPAAPDIIEAPQEEWPSPKSLDIHILPVQAELYRIADRLNRPEIKSLDTRYPVYVILTVQKALEAKYGATAAGKIMAEASSLAIKIQAHAAKHSDFRWGSRLFVADRPDPKEDQALNIADAFALKKAVTRLDADLATHGERIGALLILGGPEIVPFHYLPNPVDDQDEQIASDNPYACRGSNYFLPEWPVGRLVDGAGNDPALLLTQVERLGKAYLNPATPRRGVRYWLGRVGKGLRFRGKGASSSFGYTAAVWKPASIAAFKPVGKAHNLYTSPPFGLTVGAEKGKKPGKGVPLPSGTFAYFNLHGLVDAGEWFGQRDFASGDRYPDYPVALRPEDIRNQAASKAKKGAARLPRIVFSEACYGAHIEGKPVDQALSLAFLEAGCEAVVGSTAMSYGSINAPLIGADFLAYTFWSGLQSGMPAGEALRQARLRLAQEMNTRQGYLDGEDQKTLLSFVLYGDPLLQVVPSATGRKSITRWSSAPPIEINTICDRACQLATEAALSQDARNSIQQVVAKYLPNMQDASMTVSDERASCSSGHNCPNHMLGEKSPAVPKRRLVTLVKTFRRPDRSQTHIARLTLDQEGKVVKLVVSR